MFTFEEGWILKSVFECLKQYDFEYLLWKNRNWIHSTPYFIPLTLWYLFLLYLGPEKKEKIKDGCLFSDINEKVNVSVWKRPGSYFLHLYSGWLVLKLRSSANGFQSFLYSFSYFFPSESGLDFRKRNRNWGSKQLLVFTMSWASVCMKWFETLVFSLCFIYSS